LGVVLFGVALMIGRTAQGQSSPSEATPDPAEGPRARSSIVPPHLETSSAVPYPDQAQGDGSVVLLLTVDADGAVDEARAIEGDEPFTTAAEQTARSWHFTPASRNGQPIAAKVRFEIRFHDPRQADAGESSPPPEEGEPPDAATSAPSAEPPVAPSATPAEVTIHGERAPPQTSSLSHAEVRQLPGAFGDPFRAIEAMPGVTPIVSGLPFFYVRGAPPGNVGYFLDGVRVPYLFHVGLGPSVIHPGLVDRVDLYSGGYPATYGRFAGGIVSAETTAPRSDFHGEGNVRLFDLGALAETGFANGRGTALVAARYSYTAALFSVIARDVQLDYRDYEARVSYDFTPNDRVTVFSFGAYDLLAQDEDGQKNVLFGSEFYRLDARYDHRFASGARVRAAVTLGFDQTKIPGQPRNTRDEMIGARLEVAHPLGKRTVLHIGADATHDAYRADLFPYSDPDDPDTRRLDALFPPRDDIAAGAYVDVAYRSDDVEFTPGIRVDWFRSGSATAVGVDPRFMSRLRLAENVHVIHAFGIAHQPPSFVIPVPGLAIGDLQGGLQTALQSSAGVEVDLPEATTATVTVFDNVFLHMSDTLGVREPGDDSVLSDPRSLGAAVGAEVYIRRRLTRHLGGFIAYTLSRSTRSVGRDHFPSSFDRTHVLSVALAFDLGKNWRAGTRLTLYTGAPRVESSNGLVAPPRDPDPQRDPVFYRVDLRLEKRWVLSPSAWISFVAEMMNATLTKEVVLDQTIGPVSIPSLGLEAAF
jgi:TonB family protein